MKRFSLALSLCLFAPLAHAGVTTSLSMPIADVLKHRDVQFLNTVYGNEHNVDKGYVHDLSVCAGLWDRFEFGASTDGLGNGRLHAKAVLLNTKSGALSAGFQNVSGSQNDPFVVGRLDLPKLRIHGGWGRDDVSRALIGVDFPVTSSFTGAAEHSTGAGGYTWIGGFLAIPEAPGWSMTLGVGFPNTKADGIQHQVGLSYTLRF